VATGLTVLMGYAARDGEAAVADMLTEQGIDVPTAGRLNPVVVANDQPLEQALEQAETLQKLELIALTRLSDASRIGAGIAITTRRDLGWTRMVNPPCCKRCAVLAGKWFRWNQGFQRHPMCDCTHIPTLENRLGDVRTDPGELFANGQVTGVTKAEQRAIDDGADLNRVVNLQGVGLPGSSRLRGIYRAAGDDQARAVALLRSAGYII
jgi:hypothetical protein